MYVYVRSAQTRIEHTYGKIKRITEKQPLLELKPQQKLAIKINGTRDNYPRDLPARSTHATKTGDYQVIFNRTCMPVPIAFVSRYKIATFSGYWIATIPSRAKPQTCLLVYAGDFCGEFSHSDACD